MPWASPGGVRTDSRVSLPYPAGMQPRGIPGYAEVADWPTEPTEPLQVVEAEQLRCEGVPAWVVIADARGLRFTFGFDSFLGRLFSGATAEASEDAAWVRVGSPLEAEVYPVLERGAADPRWPWLADYVERAASRSRWVRG